MVKRAEGPSCFECTHYPHAHRDGPERDWGLQAPTLPLSSVNFFGVVRRELHLNDLPGEFETALELLAAGRVRTKPLITHRFPLAAIPEAFGAHQDPGAIKVTLAIPG